MLSSAVDISDHVKVSLKLVGQLLCELLVEYKSLLSKIGELLLTDGIIMKGGGCGCTVEGLLSSSQRLWLLHKTTPL